MKGSEAQLLGFMEGANNRYVIPVYQRKYDWKIDNCRQLYEDLKKVSRDGRSSHFFGSIVSQVVPDGSKIEFHINDGHVAAPCHLQYGQDRTGEIKRGRTR